MHLFTSQEPAVVQSFLRDNKSHSTFVPSLLVVKRVASTFVEVSLCFGFCVFWLTPLSVLCVSTCSDGLLDFHMVAELVASVVIQDVFSVAS